MIVRCSTSGLRWDCTVSQTSSLRPYTHTLCHLLHPLQFTDCACPPDRDRAASKISANLLGVQLAQRLTAKAEARRLHACLDGARGAGREAHDARPLVPRIALLCGSPGVGECRRKKRAFHGDFQTQGQKWGIMNEIYMVW